MKRRLRVYVIVRPAANGAPPETFSRDNVIPVFLTSGAALEVADHLVEGDGWVVALSELNVSLESTQPVKKS
jgi:hypothetical protein